MWSRTRWTQDWYLAVRWGWLITSVVVVIVSAVTSYGKGVVLGSVLVAYSLFLLRVTLSRRTAATE